MIVIYHKNCNDGFCAAWLLKRYYPNAIFHAANYAEAPPDTYGHAVIIADFSYPRDVLIKMHETAIASADRLFVHPIKGKHPRFHVFDHHKTAQANLEGLSFCTFDMEKSGARLIADHLGVKDNWLVDYTEDRDLWKWSLSLSREINAGLSSYPLDFDVWNRIYEAGPTHLIQEGKAILRYQQNVVDTHVAKAVIQRWPATLGYHLVPVVNATTMFSEIAGKLAEGQPFAAAYFRREDGKYQFSLRSDPNGMDVSMISKAFGGGGHIHAAGFEVDTLWF